MKYTTIRISRDTWKKIQRFKAKPGDTNETVVQYLIENYTENYND